MIKKIIDRMKDKSQYSALEIEKWERERAELREAVTKVKENIKQEAAKAGVSFLPTEVTRINPFFPMKRGEKRHYDKLEIINPWGKILIAGEKLSLYDESVLLAVLAIVEERGETFKITRYSICKKMGVTPARNTYKAVCDSIERLIFTGIKLEVWEAKTGKTISRMANNIISGYVDSNTKELHISINPYFQEMYAQGFCTYIDMEFREKLRGEISKALYRFYRGQRGTGFQCRMVTLCKAINLDADMPPKELRRQFKKALQELQDNGFLESYTIESDFISILKKKK